MELTDLIQQKLPDSDFLKIHETIEKELTDVFRDMLANGLEIPPHVFTLMGCQFIHYEKKRNLFIRLPVKTEYENPMGFMQGGMIAAAFDNAFGPLSYLVAKRAAVTLDMHTNFIRGMKAPGMLYVSAEVVSSGLRSMFLQGSAYNENAKLIAISTVQVLIVERPA